MPVELSITSPRGASQETVVVIRALWPTGVWQIRKGMNTRWFPTTFVTNGIQFTLSEATISFFTYDCFFLFSFSNAAVHYGIKWKVWSRGINCILIIIIIYLKTYRENIIHFSIPVLLKPFCVRKITCVTQIYLWSMQNSNIWNQIVTKNSLFKIPWNELSFCAYWESEFLKDMVQRITLIKQIWIIERSICVGKKEYFMCN